MSTKACISFDKVSKRQIFTLGYFVRLQKVIKENLLSEFSSLDCIFTFQDLEGQLCSVTKLQWLMIYFRDHLLSYKYFRKVLVLNEIERKSLGGS